MTRYRFRLLVDEDAVPEGCDGDPLPESPEVYARSPVLVGQDAMPYAEYCRTVGNPDNHVMLGMVLDVMRPEDDDWTAGASLWGIDFMMDEAPDLGTWYRLEDVPAGYARDVAAELMEEAAE